MHVAVLWAVVGLGFLFWFGGRSTKRHRLRIALVLGGLGAVSFVGVWVVAAVLENLYLAYSKSAIESTINDALSAVSDTQTASPSPAGEVRER